MRGAAFTLGWLLGIVGLIAHSAAAARQSNKGATIELRAKWPSTPLVMEAAEFLVRSCWLHKARSKPPTPPPCTPRTLHVAASDPAVSSKSLAGLREVLAVYLSRLHEQAGATRM